MTTNKPHPLTSKAWMTIPFQMSSKNLWDEIVDILLLLPDCLSLSREFSERQGQEPTGEEDRLRTSVLELIAALDHWFLKYPYAGNALRRPYQDSDTRKITSHYDVATALVAVYNAAYVIAYSLLLLVSPPESHWGLNSRRQLYAQAVLSADAHINSSCITIPGGGSLLMAFALKILGVWAPLSQQRDYAIRKLQNWDPQSSSNQIRRFAAPVPVVLDTKAETTNVYYANVAVEILRLREMPAFLEYMTCGPGLLDG